VAALLAVKSADWETLALSTHPEFITLIERSRARQMAEGGISGQELRRRLGLGEAARGAPRRATGRRRRRPDARTGP
jgi:hypothetical protein